MADLWRDLLDCLDLREVVPSAVFEGRNQRLSYHRVFGGQVLAQVVRAAGGACPDKTVKSLHAVFARAGRTDEPIRYEVTRAHEGGTFATLTVVARQTAGVVATAAVSMHTAEDGPDRQTLPGMPARPGPQRRVAIELLPWETRTASDLDSPEVAAPELDLWMRTEPVGPQPAPALIAYGTDLTLIGTALLPLDGVSQRDAGTAFTSAVTSHTVWFHRPSRTDDWLLLRQQAPIMAHGRCFGRGDVRTESGALVASYAQEALLRFRP
jgi:acyl-CoA thioesterase-2